jgi:hypothetical protein
MCIGFITVIKKGQDLTRPGEKDDLLEIIRGGGRRRGGESTSRDSITE